MSLNSCNACMIFRCRPTRKRSTLHPWSIAYRQVLFWSIAYGAGMEMPKCGVLVSGGLDSAVLLAELAKHSMVNPLFIEAGFPWENAELRHLNRFLDAVRAPAIQPVRVLGM